MPAGRPTKYKPEYARQAGKLCKLGATDVQLADFFEVAEATIDNWKRDHPEFLGALKEGKHFSDDLIEQSLYKKALGQTRKNVKVFQFQGKPVVVEYDEIVDCDTTAAIFWLKNRRPEQWRQNPEGGDSGVTINNIMPVPVADSVDSWESVAQANQDQLLDRGGKDD